MATFLALSTLSLAQIPPKYAENITIFHVNADTYGVAPLNMDIANIQGDAFFDLRSVASPLECANGQRSSDCTNPEVTSRDLVITKLVLTVDSRYGAYAFCNVCVNGSAGISGHCDEEGEYVCRCGHSPQPRPGHGDYLCWGGKCYESHYHGYENQTECEATCKHKAADLSSPYQLAGEYDFAAAAAILGNDRNAVNQPSPSDECTNAVGFENITSFFGGRGCRQGSPNYECWRDAVANKFPGGIWYSTLERGWCGDGTSPPAANCTWQVAEVVKIVNKTCSDNTIYNTVEVYDSSAAGTGCFKQAACGVGAARNTSSTCWIECFYSTLLGPDAANPGGAVSGMPLQDLLTAWQQPFASADPSQGGCANLPPKPHTQQQQQQQQRLRV